MPNTYVHLSVTSTPKWSEAYVPFVSLSPTIQKFSTLRPLPVRTYARSRRIRGLLKNELGTRLFRCASHVYLCCGGCPQASHASCQWRPTCACIPSAASVSRKFISPATKSARSCRSSTNWLAGRDAPRRQKTIPVATEHGYMDVTDPEELTLWRNATEEKAARTTGTKKKYPEYGGRQVIKRGKEVEGKGEVFRPRKTAKKQQDLSDEDLSDEDLWVKCGCACPCRNVIMQFEHHEAVADKEDMLRCSDWHGGCGRRICADCMGREGPSFGRLCHLCEDARRRLRERGIDTSLQDR